MRIRLRRCGICRCLLATFCPCLPNLRYMIRKRMRPERRVVVEERIIDPSRYEAPEHLRERSPKKKSSKEQATREQTEYISEGDEQAKEKSNTDKSKKERPVKGKAGKGGSKRDDLSKDETSDEKLTKDRSEANRSNADKSEKEKQTSRTALESSSEYDPVHAEEPEVDDSDSDDR